MRLATIGVLLALLPAACATPEPAIDPASLGVTNARFPAEGIMTGGQLTPEQFAALAAAGYRIVNLRTPGEDGTGWEEEAARTSGADYRRIPIGGAAGLSVDAARELDAALEGAERSVVYCGSGNRVGGLLALREHFVRGVPVEAALAAGKAAGMTRTEPRVRELMGR